MSLEEKKKKAAAVRRVLKKTIPEPKVELKYGSPEQLLVAVILSAQCTDTRVNKVTEKLFVKYDRLEKYYEVPQSELEKDIHSTGFFRNKAKSIRGMTKAVVEKHGGKLPRNLDQMVKFPGVGRKTANVILGECFEKPGIVVDTHVKRVSNRLGFTVESDPVKIEFDLQKLAPKKQWFIFSNSLLLHGRYVCVARKPKCDQCGLMKYCDYFANND